MAVLTNTNGLSTSGTGNGPRTRIINLAKSNMTEAELTAALNYLAAGDVAGTNDAHTICLLYTSPSPRDLSTSRMPSSA